MQMLSARPKLALVKTEPDAKAAEPIQTEPKAEPGAGFSASFSADHLTAIQTDDGPGSVFDVGQSVPGGAPVPARLTKDEFFSTFKMLFAIPNMVPVKPLPLQSLPIKPDEEAAARGASDAVYDIAAETAYLRWLIEPGSEWMGRLMAIGLFSFGKGGAIMAELSARSAPKAMPKADAPGAPKAAPKATPKGPDIGDAATVVTLAA